ncbi:GtrA family protein [Lacisediminihabitans profunda]|uniref:GtrA family protein n=1 Tax=Lacisediminihabitans profunda TaxID=2594790 RepID=A0A5C8UWD2_9MICO|nr:GtrA family protein [Lacisediminihabitans profunda]TXN31985.1 GtrA family protein [Lacisediminihabitans profunda]
MSRESRVALGRQLLSFILVGGVGLVVDIAVFNALRTTVLEPSLVHGGPVIAKAISTSLAILVNWTGNRLWTFRSQRRTDVLREGIEFAVVSAAGMVIALGCLWVSHYLLGYTSIIADNIATNVVGLALGTAFRFVAYRWWVYSARRRNPVAQLAPLREPKIAAR